MHLVGYKAHILFTVFNSYKQGTMVHIIVLLLVGGNTPSFTNAPYRCVCAPGEAMKPSILLCVVLGNKKDDHRSSNLYVGYTYSSIND